jgi:hypothetical protein
VLPVLVLLAPVATTDCHYSPDDDDDSTAELIAAAVVVVEVALSAFCRSLAAAPCAKELPAQVATVAQNILIPLNVCSW